MEAGTVSGIDKPVMPPSACPDRDGTSTGSIIVMVEIVQSSVASKGKPITPTSSGRTQDVRPIVLALAAKTNVVGLSGVSLELHLRPRMQPGIYSALRIATRVGIHKPELASKIMFQPMEQCQCLM